MNVREIDAVRLLGKCIGYQRVIDIAHGLDKNATKKRTADEVRTEFTRELTALLVRWGAELEAKDHWMGYAECGSDVRMTVNIDGTLDADHNAVREWAWFDIGSWLHGDHIA